MAKGIVKSFIRVFLRKLRVTFQGVEIKQKQRCFKTLLQAMARRS